MEEPSCPYVHLFRGSRENLFGWLASHFTRVKTPEATGMTSFAQANAEPLKLL